MLSAPIQQISPPQDESWWPLRIVRRIFLLLEVALVPLRLFALAFEIGAGLAFAGAVLLVLALYFHRIPDEQVRVFVGDLGTRILDLLHKQGAY